MNGTTAQAIGSKAPGIARPHLARAGLGWDAAGPWGALQRVRKHDAGGNAMTGRAHAVNATSNVVHAEGVTVVLYGVEDLVVVAKDGLVLVTTVDKSADLKTLIDALPRALVERS